jgi:uncharacterized membrane protein YciS (DUF1049 family)
MAEAIFIIVNVLLGLALLYCGFALPRRFLYLCAFLLPLQGLGLNVGIFLNWAKIILPIALLIRLLRYRNPLRIDSDSPGMRGWLLFFTYIAAITIAHLVLGTHNDEIRGLATSWGAAQSEFRLPVQLVGNIASWGVLLVGIWFVRDQRDAHAAMKGFIAGNVFNALAGFYQLSCPILGLPWLPVSLMNDMTADTGGMYDGGSMFRLSGIASEPKHAAAGFVLAIFLLLWARSSKDFRECTHQYWIKIPILGVALLLTLSTSGWVAMTVAFTFLVAVNRKWMAWRLPVMVIMLAIAGAIVWTEDAPGGVVGTIVQEHLIQRVADPGKYEYKEQAFWQFAFDHPEELIFGQGAGGIDFKLIPYVSSSNLKSKGTISPTYLFDEVLGDFGIVGLFLLIGTVWRTRSMLIAGGSAEVAQLIGGGSIVALFIPRYALWGFVLVTGALIAAHTEQVAELRQRLFAQWESWPSEPAHLALPR